MPIKDIMSRHVVTVPMDMDVYDLQKKFSDLKLHHLLVTDDKKLVGIISDRDILKCVSPYAGTVAEIERDSRTLRKKAHQIMTRNPITALKTDSIKKTGRIIIDKNIGCLPVVDTSGNLQGVVTWRDIFKYGLGEKNEK